MAHYAELDENNVVIRVIPGVDENMDGETIYQAETGRVWKRTSYNTLGGVHSLGGIPFRKNYAGIGFTYDEQRDAFIPPKHFSSWVLDEETCQWNPPTPMPNDGGHYEWNESLVNWKRIDV
jgi:hypothetical protein